MVNTNELLSVSFALLAAFGGQCRLPARLIPHSTNEIATFQAGELFHPLNIHIVHSNISEFWIQRGAVAKFRLLSFSSTNTIARAATPLEEPSSGMTASDAVLYGEGVLRALSAGSEPGSGVVPSVAPLTESGKADVSGYHLRWLLKDRGWFQYTAEMVVDPRTKALSYLSLLSPSFNDPAREMSMSNRVIVSVPTGRVTEAVNSMSGNVSAAASDPVAEALASWLTLCRTLAVDPGAQTNLIDIDWNRCRAYTNREISTNTAVLQLWFRNGAGFECIRGKAFSHYSADSCFGGSFGQRTAADWGRFRGTVRIPWEPQARAFERSMVTNLSVSSNILRTLKLVAINVPPELGAQGFTRVSCGWFVWPTEWESVREMADIPVKATCEIDLVDGSIKWFHIDPRLLGLVE